MNADKLTLLIVENDALMREQLRSCLQAYEVVTAENGEKAIAQMRRFEPAVIILDLGLPPEPNGVGEGLKTLEALLALQPNAKIISIAESHIKNIAMQAMSAGSYDFYQKPLDLELLRLIVERAVHVFRLEHAQYRSSVSPKPHIPGLLYSSRAMDKVCKIIEKVAPTNANVLLLGESGSGKEVIARGIHRLSGRASEKFVAINCAAIPDNLLESELLGTELGAFTGATKRMGKIESAHGGTLFLDEIGDLPLSLQPKLLRFLQERVIERLGGREEIMVDVRVLCATNQSLKSYTQENRFREDLYYRISEVVIHIPALRAREQDVLLLARMFLNRFNTEMKRRLKGFSRSALELIESYSWPGNVRELENCIKRAVIMTDSSCIRAEDLDIPINTRTKMPFNLRRVREQAEEEAIRRALQYMDGNVSKAADLLGVTRPTLYNLMDKLEMREKLHEEA